MADDSWMVFRRRLMRWSSVWMPRRGGYRSTWTEAFGRAQIFSWLWHLEQSVSGLGDLRYGAWRIMDKRAWKRCWRYCMRTLEGVWRFVGATAFKKSRGVV